MHEGTQVVANSETGSVATELLTQLNQPGAAWKIVGVFGAINHDSADESNAIQGVVAGLVPSSPSSVDDIVDANDLVAIVSGKGTFIPLDVVTVGPVYHVTRNQGAAAGAFNLSLHYRRVRLPLDRWAVLAKQRSS